MSVGRRTLLLPAPGGKERADPGHSVVVVGGGIAGVAAATVLAERGVHVTLLEKEQHLGGRMGAWSAERRDGERFEMERGFHAFFRQYYNLRALLRRIDPDLRFLRALADYPILGPDGLVQSFANLPRRTPHNIVALTRRTRPLGWRALLRVNKRRALEMLAFDMERTYARWDETSAALYLDSLRFPPAARPLLFDVFSHSFFNPEAEMSAAELLMMFHFYFTGNPEGLVFDVARQPFSRSIWEPFAVYLRRLHVELCCGEEGLALRRHAGSAPGGDSASDAAKGAGNSSNGASQPLWQVVTSRRVYPAHAVVLAVTVPALQSIVQRSADLDDPAWRNAIAVQRPTRPFAVWRLWLDGPVRAGRTAFVGTTGVGGLDNISLYHLFEDESREWSARHGGSVVELHAYAVAAGADEARLRRDMLRGLHHFYPETAQLRILDGFWLLRQDCPAFSPGTYAARPTVATPHPGVTVAGDFVKLPLPSALMERAAAAGFLAANLLLARLGVRPEPIECIPPRGILSGLPLG